MTLRRAKLLFTAFCLSMSVAIPGIAGEEQSLCDFEDQEALRLWEKGNPIELVGEHATEGERCAKVALKGAMVAGSWKGLPRDWSRSDHLALDLFNPGKPFRMTLRIRDAQKKTYDVWGHLVPSGKHTIELSLTKAYVKIDVSNVSQFWFHPASKADPPPVVYLDNLRFVTGAGVTSPPAEWSDDQKSVSPGDGGARVMVDFEDPRDLRLFEITKGNAEIVAEHATSGRQALKVAAGTYLVSWRLPRNWAGFDALEVDVFNAGPQSVGLYVLIGDQAWKQAGSQYWDRYNGSHSIPPGQSTFSLSITGLYRGEAGSRFNNLKTAIDPARIIRLDFGFGKGEGALYLDKLRLIKAAVPEGIRAFDFGPPSQFLQPGFTPVSWDTLYTKEKGYGLTQKRSHSNRARDDTFPSRLYRDFVEMAGWRKGEFVVDLPNGAYHVFLVYDDCGYWGGEACRHTKRSIQAEGNIAWSEDRGDHGSYWEPNYLFESVEPLPGQDLWERYVSRIFVPKEFAVTVEDGQLNLKFDADAPWSSKVATVIIYPDSIAKTGKQFVERTVASQRREFTVAAAERPTPAGGALDAIPEEERKKGYLFFLTDYERETYLTTIPSPGQFGRPVEIYAARGEHEPITFAVRPLTDLGEATVAVSDLKSKTATISKDCVDVRVVRHLARRGFNAINYRIIPQMLKRFSSVALPKDFTRQFWLTVRVPKDAKPGDYAGTVRVTSRGGLDETLSVALHVYPFTLDGSDYVFGFFGTNERNMAILREHGMNSFSGGRSPILKGFDAQKQPIVDFTEADAFMRAARDNGYTREICGYGGPSIRGLGECDRAGIPKDEALRRVFAAIKKHAEASNWLPFTFNMCDEPRGDPERIKRQIEWMKTVGKAAPWLKTIGMYSLTGKSKGHALEIFKALRASGLNNHDARVLEMAREMGKEVYIYNQGQSRYSFGLYQWSEYQKGVKGRYQWIAHIQHGFQFFDLDGREPDTGVLYYGEREVIPALNLKRCQEGADDFYYCQTLWNLIQRAKESGRARQRAAEAEKCLNGLTDKVSVNQRRKPDWLDQDSFRRQLAQYILTLSRAL